MSGKKKPKKLRRSPNKMTQAVERIENFSIQYRKEHEKTDSDKLDNLTEKINDLNKAIIESDCTAFELVWKSGRYLLEMKDVANKSKKGFQAEFKKRVQKFTLRTAQRRMKLAEKVDLKAEPVLVVLGQTRALELCGLLKEPETANAFLKRKRVSLPVTIEKPWEVRKFLKTVDNLLDRSPNKKRGLKSKNSQLPDKAAKKSNLEGKEGRRNNLSRIVNNSNTSKGGGDSNNKREKESKTENSWTHFTEDPDLFSCMLFGTGEAYGGMLDAGLTEIDHVKDALNVPEMVSILNHVLKGAEDLIYKLTPEK